MKSKLYNHGLYRIWDEVSFLQDLEIRHVSAAYIVLKGRLEFKHLFQKIHLIWRKGVKSWEIMTKAGRKATKTIDKSIWN